MKKKIWVLAVAPLAFSGCTTVVERPVPVTTEVRQEVVTTTPGAAVTREIIVTKAPPTVRVETQTVSPGARYLWTRGYWQWTGTRHVWTPGKWVVRPSTSAVWVEGRWERRSGGWVWIAGHWQ